MSLRPSGSANATPIDPTVLPCLLQQSDLCWSGYVTAGSSDYRVALNLSPSGSLAAATLSVEPELAALLGDSVGILTSRLHKARNLNDFFIEFKDILSRVKHQGDDGGGMLSVEFYNKVLGELDVVGWDNVSSVSESLDSVTLVYTDESLRKHELEMKLSQRYPSVAPGCSTALPVSFVPRWAADSNLASVYSQFIEYVKVFQEFWDVMDDLDENTWVLEPEHPSRSSNVRRIALGNHCSLNVEINPRNPNAIPEMRFLGSDNAVAAMQLALNQNIQQWKRGDRVRVNVERVLGIEFPKKGDSDVGDIAAACGICYAFRSSDAVPDVVCDKETCGQPYHAACLVQWLRSLTTSRVSFDTVFGKCVYCESTIAVKISSAS